MQTITVTRNLIQETREMGATILTLAYRSSTSGRRMRVVFMMKAGEQSCLRPDQKLYKRVRKRWEAAKTAQALSKPNKTGGEGEEGEGFFFFGGGGGGVTTQGGIGPILSVLYLLGIWATQIC